MLYDLEFDAVPWTKQHDTEVTKKGVWWRVAISSEV